MFVCVFVCVLVCLCQVSIELVDSVSDADGTQAVIYLNKAINAGSVSLVVSVGGAAQTLTLNETAVVAPKFLPTRQALDLLFMAPTAAAVLSSHTRENVTASVLQYALAVTTVLLEHVSHVQLRDIAAGRVVVSIVLNNKAPSTAAAAAAAAVTRDLTAGQRLVVVGPQPYRFVLLSAAAMRATVSRLNALANATLASALTVVTKAAAVVTPAAPKTTAKTASVEQNESMTNTYIVIGCVLSILLGIVIVVILASECTTWSPLF